MQKTHLDRSYVPDVARSTRDVRIAGVDRAIGVQPEGPADVDTIACLTHELRTPLSTLDLTLELLEDFPSLEPDEVQQHLDRLRRSLTWVNSLIDDVTLWASLRDGKLALRREPVDLRACVEHAVGLVRPLLRRRGQDTVLSQPDEAVVVYADEHRIGQVLLNLLTNAATYGAVGDVMHVSITQTGGDVRVTVADHGPGIGEQEQRHIFDARYRGSRGRETHAGGQGLGLYIVRAVVEMHGGKVGVDSAPGEGAAFWFRLPLRTAPRVDALAATLMQ